MRHKYATRGIVLSRTSIAEAATLVTLLTPDLGVLRARAEGLRRPGAKLASSLQTLSECDVTLVRGKEGWRLSGALLVENWFSKLDSLSRARAGRVAGLLLRLVHGEVNDPALYRIYTSFLLVLPELSEEAQDGAECVVALRLLAALGLDTGELPETMEYGALPQDLRRDLINRINRGISASGL